MTKMAGVSVTYGKIVLSKSGQTVSSFRLKAPFQKDSAAQVGTVDLRSKESMAATRYRDIGGGFTRQRVELPANSLILLQISRTKNGTSYADAAIILRLREGADVLSISAKLPVGPESVLGDALQIFAGSADICDMGELQLLGIRIPKYYADRYMAQEEIDELFEISVVRPGLIAKPTLHAVATSEGVVIKAVGEEATRRIRLRRPNDN